MKRISFLALSLAMTVLLMCGCGASSGGGNNTAAASPPMADMAAPDAGGAYGNGDFETGEMAPAEPGSPRAPADSRIQNAKLIYTANLELETTAFEQADQDLATLVEQMGGYFEQSSVNNYGNGYRNGSYTVRVPAAQFKPFCEQAGKLCHLTFKSTQAENVSEAYYDTESRLTTQKTKLERLQVLLSKADKMEDIITLESAISEAELAIEQLSGTLRQYDALVDYATIYLTLSEVYKLSNTEEPASDFSQRLSTALASGWKNFVSGGEGLLVSLAYGWPWLLVLTAVAASAAAVVIRRVRRDRTSPKGPGTKPGDLPPAPPAE